jgi:hypothetical protein
VDPYAYETGQHLALEKLGAFKLPGLERMKEIGQRLKEVPAAYTGRNVDDAVARMEDNTRVRDAMRTNQVSPQTVRKHFGEVTPVLDWANVNQAKRDHDIVREGVNALGRGAGMAAGVYGAAKGIQKLMKMRAARNVSQTPPRKELP